ncbi:hypothetical protein [Thiocapsa imhoffii]|nr:hypothetical protein [Thiocapsa imhoffii]
MAPPVHGASWPPPRYPGAPAASYGWPDASPPHPAAYAHPGPGLGADPGGHGNPADVYAAIQGYGAPPPYWSPPPYWAAPAYGPPHPGAIPNNGMPWGTPWGDPDGARAAMMRGSVSSHTGGTGQGHGGPGMAALIEDIANGGNGLSSLSKMLNFEDSEFWKGALLGAAAVFVLTNESVQSALFKTGAKTKAAVKTGVERVRDRPRPASEHVEQASSDER